MKFQMYRGTTLQEAKKLLQKKILKKYLYRITSKEESEGYADINKWNDKYEMGTILEANMKVPEKHLMIFAHGEIDDFHNKKAKRYRDKIGIYRTGVFDVILIPPKFHSYIQNPKIIEIV